MFDTGETTSAIRQIECLGWSYLCISLITYYRYLTARDDDNDDDDDDDDENDDDYDYDLYMSEFKQMMIVMKTTTTTVMLVMMSLHLRYHICAVFITDINDILLPAISTWYRWLPSQSSYV